VRFITGTNVAKIIIDVKEGLNKAIASFSVCKFFFRALNVGQPNNFTGRGNDVELPSNNSVIDAMSVSIHNSKLPPLTHFQRSCRD
jgi:hypothetical protein